MSVARCFRAEFTGAHWRRRPLPLYDQLDGSPFNERRLPRPSHGRIDGFSTHGYSLDVARAWEGLAVTASAPRKRPSTSISAGTTSSGGPRCAPTPSAASARERERRGGRADRGGAYALSWSSGWWPTCGLNTTNRRGEGEK